MNFFNDLDETRVLRQKLISSLGKYLKARQKLNKTVGLNSMFIEKNVPDYDRLGFIFF